MRVLWRVIRFIAVTAVSLYFSVCVVLFVAQRSLIYYPQPRLNTNVAQIHLPVGANTDFVSVDRTTKHDALIYFGGNAEDVSSDIPDLVKAFPDRAVYALHYPGYGGSSGKPTQKAIFDAALTLFDRVHADHPSVVVIGRSLGSGVAVWTASQRPVSRLVLVTPFDSLGDAAQQQYPFLPVRLLLRDKYNSGKYAPLVRCPTQIVIAEQDELIPRSSSDRLIKRFKRGLASVTVLPNVGHNTIQESPNYWSTLASGT